ncbi:3-keto-disaccharide hydrolase [Paludisphaera rhizosphaerae]|uniref:3-keto-disaccharide hydrolase n=1 Tax=Paludisphaera rhizosphaerae TaxID=2711216 RepID=UPI0013EB67E2|nr:DUF1080 domain-containing protein [Paludisphaera rhizosphaerae]
MPTIRPALALSALVVSFGLAASAKAEEPAPLLKFNGKNLDGFYTYLHNNKYADPDGVFTVVDGELRISGKELGGVCTKGEFENYRLITEWRWTGETHPPRTKAARDSGILLHCTGPDDAHGGHWMRSMECQLIEGGSGDFIVVTGSKSPEPMSLSAHVRQETDKQWYYTPDGSGELRAFNGGRINWWGRKVGWKDEVGIRGEKDVEKPVGEWNTMEVVCDGDKITNILNGHVVNVGEKSTVTKGKVTFQSEFAGVAFRRIEILPLKK